MSEDYLRLRFDDDGDGTGKLHARAEAHGFAGEGAAHFAIPRPQAFASSLLAFPLPAEPPASLAGGFWDKGKAKTLEQEHLAITAYPIDKTRRIGVQVRMATEAWNH